MSMLPNPDMPLFFNDRIDPETGEVSQPVTVNERREAIRRQSFSSDLPSLTQQQFVEESDINHIIARYRVSGFVPSNGRQPMYDDFSNLPSYQEALDIVNRGADAFMSLSSDVRAQFENDPSKFLDFAGKDENRDQLVKWGVVAPEPIVSKSLDDVYDALTTKSSEEPKAP